MRIKYLYLASISGALVSIDQLSKVYIHTHFHLGESLSLITNFLSFTYVRNPGAAFGFLADTAPAFRDAFFLSMPPIALLIILAILRGVDDTEKKLITALSLIFAGAIGNYIDRLHYSYVVDFIDFTYRYSKAGKSDQVLSWPAFNIADIAIVCGVASLLLIEFLRVKQNAKAK